MKKNLRWGFLSTAHISQKLILPIQKSKNHQIIAVASRDESKARAYAKQFQIPQSYGNYEALLADPQIDVIYNPLPNHLHAEWTIKACQAGKHVLCEKPMALSLDEIDAMHSAAQKAGVVIQEAFMYRHHPQTLKAKELVDSGYLGQVRLGRGVFTFYLKDDENVRLKPEMGGGSLWDVGVYPVSYLRTMLGLEPETVWGVQQTGPSGVDIGFSGEMVFQKGRALGQFQCGFNAVFHTSIELIGDEGSLYIPVPFSPYTHCEMVHYWKGKNETVKVKGQDLYLGELDNMAECVFNGKPTRVTIEDSQANTRVILGLLESARSGNKVRIGTP